MDTKFSAEAENYPMSGLTFLGLISLVDPPKASVPAAVQLCRQAGIKVLMVTGDHVSTTQHTVACCACQLMNVTSDSFFSPLLVFLIALLGHDCGCNRASSRHYHSPDC